jgi:hypothetical protein
MGDRWSFPRQASSATQVWLPITVNEDTCSILEYWPVWEGESISRISPEGVDEPLPFRSNGRGDSVCYGFEGSRIMVYGTSDCHGGYAEFSIYDDRNELIHRVMIDFYSLVPDSNMKYVSPKLIHGSYTLKVGVMGEHGVWYKKDGTQFGSDDYFVTLESVKVCS